MLSLSVPENPSSIAEGLRPVNLRTDLGPLADLIELAFSDTMDNGGRAAIREMRTLSHIGVGLNVLAGVNELAQGMNLGYVYIANGRLVGNVSVYPANLPPSLGSTWIIANVAVHPEYRGRGIASQLMQASMAMLRNRGASAVILQVESDNDVARRLYSRLGFTIERTWTSWRRPSGLRVPQAFNYSARDFDITHRRRGEWRAEMALAERVRPQITGGLGWLRPLYRGLFQKSLWKQVSDWVSLNADDHLIIRSHDERRLDAALWIESGFASSSVRLTLMVEPEFMGRYDDALVNLAVRRHGLRQPITIEHPADETATSNVLQSYHFRPQRTLTHMRWEPERKSIEYRAPSTE